MQFGPKLSTEDLGNSKVINLLFKPAGLVMSSRLRHRLLDPVKTLNGAGLKSGQTVLEVGCGTGFFTIPAARLIGEHGKLLAMDVMTSYLDLVSEKVRAAKLTNVRILKQNALKTELESECIDTVLLFGVIPYPSLPLKRLLPEMHRVLKPDGHMAVWLFPIPGWVPKSIARSGLFTFIGKRNGVYNYERCHQNSPKCSDNF